MNLCVNPDVLWIIFQYLDGNDLLAFKGPPDWLTINLDKDLRWQEVHRTGQCIAEKPHTPIDISIANIWSREQLRQYLDTVRIQNTRSIMETCPQDVLEWFLDLYGIEEILLWIIIARDITRLYKCMLEYQPGSVLSWP